MARAKVFIASSSEGYPIAKTIRGLLLQELGAQAEVKPWTREFALSATYIESLEKAAHEADFAVLVLTPDDITSSRDQEQLSPRDNVVFELGLFMGSLGRDRCFIVHEKNGELKLPSDLLGVKAAEYSPTKGGLAAVLDPPCFLIAERIARLGVRPKLDPDLLAAQQTIRSFSERIEGSWWEKISGDDLGSISFFQIEAEPQFNAVRLGGKSYDRQGGPVAKWKSQLARLNPAESKILYHWTGWYSRKERANLPFHGFGEIEFDKPATDSPINRGSGRFWDVDEAHPEKTIVKPIELRRISDPQVIETIHNGTRKQIKVLLQKVMAEW